eukprot:scaffold260363_cov31-Tisochrysis_lutea.AAC.2
MRASKARQSGFAVEKAEGELVLLWRCTRTSQPLLKCRTETTFLLNSTSAPAAAQIFSHTDALPERPT